MNEVDCVVVLNQLSVFTIISLVIVTSTTTGQLIGQLIGELVKVHSTIKK